MIVPNVRNLLLKKVSVMVTVLVQACTKGFCASEIFDIFTLKRIVRSGLGSKIYF